MRIIQDEFTGTGTPMSRLIARRKKRGVCVMCAKEPIAEGNANYGVLCLEKVRAANRINLRRFRSKPQRGTGEVVA